jgi:hypothetical protein
MMSGQPGAPRLLLGVALAELRCDEAAVETFDAVLELRTTCLDARAAEARRQAIYRPSGIPGRGALVGGTDWMINGRSPVSTMIAWS